MLYLIGLGLGDERDITIKGLDAIKDCSSVYLDCFTSILSIASKDSLERLYGKKIIEADRHMIENGCDSIINEAMSHNVAVLVVGDPFGATTHTGLILRAHESGVEVRVIHNASIMTAVGKCGLQLYSFGQTVSLVFHSDKWKPLSFYDKIYENLCAGLHTLCLLDIRIKEQSEDSILRGLISYEQPRFMTIKDAVELLFYAQSERRYNVCLEKTIGIGFARVGAQDEVIKSGTLPELINYDFGGPLHTLVIAGKMHFIERDVVRSYSINSQSFEDALSAPSSTES